MSERDPVLSAEAVGTFVDAVYAIAITLLALELPRELGGAESWDRLARNVGEFAIAFAILFGIWIHHRRINAFMEAYDRRLLLTTGLILLMISLLPTATALVFAYGADVTMGEIEPSLLHGARWTRAEFVDLFFVGIVLVADSSLLLLAWIGLRETTGDRARAVRARKTITTALLIALTALSFLVPVPNRYFLLMIPLTLIFEGELGRMARRLGAWVPIAMGLLFLGCAAESPEASPAPEPTAGWEEVSLEEEAPSECPPHETEASSETAAPPVDGDPSGTSTVEN